LFTQVSRLNIAQLLGGILHYRFRFAGIGWFFAARFGSFRGRFGGPLIVIRASTAGSALRAVLEVTGATLRAVLEIARATRGPILEVTGRARFIVTPVVIAPVIVPAPRWTRFIITPVVTALALVITALGPPLVRVKARAAGWPVIVAAVTISFRAIAASFGEITLGVAETGLGWYVGWAFEAWRRRGSKVTRGRPERRGRPGSGYSPTRPTYQTQVFGGLVIEVGETAAFDLSRFPLVFFQLNNSFAANFQAGG
jgi:hypothetical protein